MSAGARQDYGVGASCSSAASCKSGSLSVSCFFVPKRPPSKYIFIKNWKLQVTLLIVQPHHLNQPATSAAGGESKICTAPALLLANHLSCCSSKPALTLAAFLRFILISFFGHSFLCFFGLFFQLLCKMGAP